MPVVEVIVAAGVGEDVHFSHADTPHILMEQAKKACADPAATIRLVHHEKHKLAVKGRNAVFNKGVIGFIETLEQVLAVSAVLGA